MSDDDAFERRARDMDRCDHGKSSLDERDRDWGRRDDEFWRRFLEEQKKETT